MTIFSKSAVGVLFALPLLAQPDAGRASTETVYAGGDYPENRIVQGSVFRVDGLNLAAGEQVAGFPLPKSLGGTSIRVTAGASSVDALILSTPVFMFPDGPRPSVRAVLPSNTPLGDADLVLSFGGRDSRPLKIRVVKRDFGVYNLVHNIDGPGLIRQNTLESPARPGQLVGIWGTGLGPVEGDEASGPLPSAIPVAGLEVLVGDMPAKVTYAGRSGCCAGIDQIFFEVPAGVEGCSVPVKVRYPDGNTADAPETNFGEAALVVASSPGDCASLARKLRYGRINFSAGYSAYGDASFYIGGPDVLPPMGTCGGGTYIPRTSPLDAGAAVNLGMPQGSITYRKATVPVQGPPPVYYWGTFGGELRQGDYVLDNGAGGTGIGPFRTPFSLPDISFAWTNQDALSVRPDEGLRITWNRGVPGDGYVAIQGTFSIGGVDGTRPLLWADNQGYFSCVARVENGTFLVPAADMWTSFTRASDHLELSVFYVHKQQIDVAGLDLSEFVYNLGAYKAVKLH